MFKKIIKYSIYLFFLISFVLIFAGFHIVNEKKYARIPLEHFFNRDGVSWLKNPGDGNFDDRNCYPADELPETGEVFADSIPFLFPSKEDGENNCLIPHKQKITIPKGKYGAFYVLGSSVNGPSSIEVTLNYKGGFEQELLYLSDWCHEPDFTEKTAFKAAYRLSSAGKVSRSPSIWLQVLEVNPDLELESVGLSDAENMRIFALTLGKELPDLTPEQIFSRLSYEDPGVKDYWLHFQSVKSVLHSLSLSTATLEEVEQIYHETLNSIDFSQSFKNRKAFLSSIEKAKAKLNSAITKAEKDLLESNALARDLDIFLLGQSHIDAAWLWRKYNTVEKCRFTFAQAIDHLKKHPTFLYAQSVPQFYLWAERYFPELSKEIESAIKAGRWEIVGGNWVEPDNNLPDGESLIRQRLYGQRYFFERFGRISEVAWIPDSFGFNWNLPQILAKTGAKYFVTTKILWNDTNKFPFNVFIWQAPDGSQVLSYLGIRGYGTFPEPYLDELEKFKKQNRLLKDQAIFNAENVCEKYDNLFAHDYVKEIAYLYGAGDGGHGPTPKEVNSALVLSSLKPWKHEKISNYFQELEKYRDKLPIWNDELYLEYHRGTYTSQADIKKLNRESEVLLLSGEKFSSVAALFGHHYHKNDLERAWRILLFNQFHDILPGSSIPEVYVDAKEDYDVLKKIGHFVLKDALTNLAQHVNTQGEGQAVIVFNPLPWKRKDIAKIEWVKESASVYNPVGEEISSQVVEEDGKYFLIFPAEVPSLGYAVYRILPGSKDNKGQLKADSTSMENEYLKITINQMGWLSSVYDKRNNKELLAGEGNVLQAFTDKPKDWDAWNIATDYEKYPLAMPSPEIQVIESGPVRCRLRITRDFRNSSFIQDISLYEGMPLVEMRLKADWQETQTLLKVSFPVNVKAENLVAEIPYAVYSRPTNPQSPMEKAKWEFPAQRWVDLSADGYGVSLLNRSKYGHDIKGNQMRLSLLKSAIWPDAKADRGKHLIQYALYPHQGDWKEATVYRRGQEYNYPLYSVLSPSHSGKLPNQFSFFEVSPKNVILYAVKKAEDNNGIILRVYETTGTPTQVEVKVPKRIKAAFEVDFLEMKKLAPIKNEGQSITFDLGKFEIKTISLNYD